MDYAEAQQAFFSPREGDATDLGWTTPARRLRDAIEPLAAIGFWAEPVVSAYADLGLDFLAGYAWARASALGEPVPEVAAAAFGVFEPGAVAALYDAGRAACSGDAVAAARRDGSAAALRTVLGDPGDVDGLAETIAALRAAVAGAPGVGRPLFAGLSAQPWPEDPWAQLWHVCTLLREHRGDGHLATVVGAGLDGLQANILTELWVGWEPLAYTGTRAWSPEAMADAVAALERRGLVHDHGLTDAGRALREGMETATDAAEQGVVDALTTHLSDHVGDGFDDLLARLDGWSQRVVDHGWFPPDPYKRACG